MAHANGILNVCFFEWNCYLWLTIYHKWLSRINCSLISTIGSINRKILLQSHQDHSTNYAWAFLGLLGIGFIFYKDSLQVHAGHYALGVGLSMFAMLTWSVGSIIISRTKIDLNPYYSIGWQMFLSAVTMGLFTYFSGNYIPIKEIPAISWGVIVYMVIGGSVFAFISFIYSIETFASIHCFIICLYKSNCGHLVVPYC